MGRRWPCVTRLVLDAARSAGRIHASYGSCGRPEEGQPDSMPSAPAQFPVARPRRLRRTPNLRRMVRQTRLSVDRLIYPVFVVSGADVKEEIASMPGVYHQSVDRLLEDAH